MNCSFVSPYWLYVESQVISSAARTNTVRWNHSHPLPAPWWIFLDLGSQLFKRKVLILFSFVFHLCCKRNRGLSKRYCVANGSTNDRVSPKTIFLLHSAELGSHLWHYLWLMQLLLLLMDVSKLFRVNFTMAGVLLVCRPGNLSVRLLVYSEEL